VDYFNKMALVYSAELLTNVSYTNFTVSYRAALVRLRVHLNIILYYRGSHGEVTPMKQNKLFYSCFS